MIPCLIKFDPVKGNHQGFSLIELLMSVAFTLLLMTGILSFYNAASQSFNAGINAENYQTAVSIIINKILHGSNESGINYRLSTSVSYMIPNGDATALYSCGGNPQVTPCNTDNPSSELYFCQDSPCNGAFDPSARWYYLNATSTAVIYHHPAPGIGTVEENVYTAPAGSSIKLRFVPAALNTPSRVIEIDLAITQNLNPGITNSRLAASGSVTSYVLLRNHP